MSIIRQGFESADLDIPVVLPTLNLDFANSQSLDKRITFSRGSIGTRVNRNGLIETIPANAPRFDFDPISGECKGLLIEESRSNLLPPSIPDNVGTVNLTVVVNSIISPSGELNASLFIENTSNGEHYKDYGPGLTSGVTYTFSVFYKAGPGNRNFSMRVAGINVAAEIVNVTNNTITGAGSIVNYGNGWYRAYYSFTATATGGTTVRFQLHNPYVYTGDGTSGVYLWGAQLEAGAFPTSYIPTTASTVTRSADNASMTGTNFSSVFGLGTPSELSVFYSGLAPYASTNGAYYWQLTNNAITERIVYRYAGQPQVIPYINGLSMGGVFISATQNINIKSVGLIDNKSFAIRANDGNPQYQFANATIPRIPTGFQQLNIGSSSSGFNYLNGTIRKLAFYPKRLSSSQAVYLTQ